MFTTSNETILLMLENIIIYLLFCNFDVTIVELKKIGHRNINTTTNILLKTNINKL